MKTIVKGHRESWITSLGVVVAAFTFTAALAGVGPEGNATSIIRADQGGNVLPPTARPKGYSLSGMAQVTAFFNTGDRTGEPPDTPFQILYTSASNNNTFDISPGTMLYVPVFYSDDSPLIVGDFPNVGNRQAVLKYFYSQDELGGLRRGHRRRFRRC